MVQPNNNGLNLYNTLSQYKHMYIFVFGPTGWLSDATESRLISGCLKTKWLTNTPLFLKPTKHFSHLYSKVSYSIIIFEDF